MAELEALKNREPEAQKAQAEHDAKLSDGWIARGLD